MRERIDSLIYSFPVQLLFHHVRRNLALVILWLLFIATVGGGIGKIYGIHYLYLDPEYLNKVNFWSFFLVGLAFGNFTMAFHITCYILDGHRFTFVGILERPFIKFSVNNSLLPLLALISYISLIVNFQLHNEYSSASGIIWNVSGLLAGIVIMQVIFYFYFRLTNKDIFRFLAGAVDKRLRKAKLSRERMMNKLTETKQRRYKVYTYLDAKLRVRSCDGLEDFYDKEAVLKVFDQNHFNSVVVELAVIVLIMFLGTFMDNKYLQIPAAASSLLLFSFVVMLIGAFSYWLRGWGVAFVFGLFLLVNVLGKLGIIKGEYKARGLDYSIPKVNYSLSQLEQLNNREFFIQDSLKMISILNNWKAKQTQDKPQFIMLCVSGGGQRAALWTVNSLLRIDESLGESVMNKIGVITGASGGMIGAAYSRELYLRQLKGEKVPLPSEQLKNIGKDNLNPIIFSLLVNDAFLRVRSMEYMDKHYLKDRGYVFEDHLNENLGGVLGKRLSDYQTAEANAEIPLMIMSPVISNDGRKLYISTQGTSFMNLHPNSVFKEDAKISGIDFNCLFADHGAEDLSFLTALRMSASFPYITPTVSLPSQPTIEIMDAGIADNFGVSDAARFVYVFQDWIVENTSGVTLLVIRDTRKNAPIEPKSKPTLMDKLTYPIASVYNNLGNIQDINNEAEVERMKSWLHVPLNVVEIEYNTYTNITEEYLLEAKETERKQLERASLSWHLTTREKQNVIENIELPNNQQALTHLKNILEN